MNDTFNDYIEAGKKIASEKIKPLSVETDNTKMFPRNTMRMLGENGFYKVGVPDKFGGINGNRENYALMVKELAKACASTALIYVSHTVLLKAIELAAGEKTRNKYLPDLMNGNLLGAFAVHEQGCGSNAGAISTTAVKKGNDYVVNGSKFFITSGGEADVYMVLVRTDPDKGPQGMSMLLIKKDNPGLSFGRVENKMGLTSTSSREMFFNDCIVPAEYLLGGEGEGLPILGKTLISWGFYGAAAISAGIADAASGIAINHAVERKIAGQSLASHQSIQNMVADMTLKSDTISAYLEKCANNADISPDKAAINAFKTKLYASETAIEVTDLAIQIMGGHGYSQDYIVERLYRDARGLKLHFKTSEWLRQDIAKSVLGL